ncbi:hypothetical protein BJX62DRAFT_235327 [Aspergillus germanicus]
MAIDMALLLHDLPFDTPQASEIWTHEDTGTIYAWIMTEAEKRHISSMLEVLESDIESSPAPAPAPAPARIHLHLHLLQYLTQYTVPLIKTSANTFQDRSVCDTCGKHSGVDDLVHNALYMGIHSRNFMWETVTGARASEGGVEHKIISSRCGTFLKEGKNWGAVPPRHK